MSMLGIEAACVGTILEDSAADSLDRNSERGKVVVVVVFLEADD